MLIDDIQMIRTVVCISAVERIAHSLAISKWHLIEVQVQYYIRPAAAIWHQSLYPGHS